MQVAIPLQPVPNQRLQVSLGGQPCILQIYQYNYGLFIDVLVGNSYVAAGRSAQNLNRIVRAAYTGFIGDLVFKDTKGSSHPDYTGLGSRYQLIYDDTGFAAFLR